MFYEIDFSNNIFSKFQIKILVSKLCKLKCCLQLLRTYKKKMIKAHQTRNILIVV